MIILMAMRKEPESRYVSADQFADDLKLYLKGLPVRAHPDSATYRTIKFMRRHAAAVVAGGVFVFAFVAGVAGITAELIMAHRERDRALESSRRRTRDCQSVRYPGYQGAASQPARTVSASKDAARRRADTSMRIF